MSDNDFPLFTKDLLKAHKFKYLYRNVLQKYIILTEGHFYSDKTDETTTRDSIYS